jgi:hypothetical protein
MTSTCFEENELGLDCGGFYLLHSVGVWSKSKRKDFGAPGRILDCFSEQHHTLRKT